VKLLEYEAKDILKKFGIQVPKGTVIEQADTVGDRIRELGDSLVFKAQVDVGGRGKTGGILFGEKKQADSLARELFRKTITTLPIRKILIEERLPTTHEYFVSITIDRSKREPLILFAESGGVDIETLASEQPVAIRRLHIPSLFCDIPSFALRDLLGNAPRELGPVINTLYHLFREKDAILAEINPLVTTPTGIFAADAKLIIDDNALQRQGVSINRDLSDREREAEHYGFSYVELAGDIGVIGNGAGLTMATVDLIAFQGGKAANFLDVGGGADQERVMHAVRLVAGMPSVKVILVNLLGGITRCDEVARGIIDAKVPQKIVARLAGTNEMEGKKLLADYGYIMYETMGQAVEAAVVEVEK